MRRVTQKSLSEILDAGYRVDVPHLHGVERSGIVATLLAYHRTDPAVAPAEFGQRSGPNGRLRRPQMRAPYRVRRAVVAGLACTAETGSKRFAPVEME